MIAWIMVNIKDVSKYSYPYNFIKLCHMIAHHPQLSSLSSTLLYCRRS